MWPIKLKKHYGIIFPSLIVIMSTLLISFLSVSFVTPNGTDRRAVVLTVDSLLTGSTITLLVLTGLSKSSSGSSTIYRKIFGKTSHVGDMTPPYTKFLWYISGAFIQPVGIIFGSVVATLTSFMVYAFDYENHFDMLMVIMIILTTIFLFASLLRFYIFNIYTMDNTMIYIAAHTKGLGNKEWTLGDTLITVGIVKTLILGCNKSPIKTKFIFYIPITIIRLSNYIVLRITFSRFHIFIKRLLLEIYMQKIRIFIIGLSYIRGTKNREFIKSLMFALYPKQTNTTIPSGIEVEVKVKSGLEYVYKYAHDHFDEIIKNKENKGNKKNAKIEYSDVINHLYISFPDTYKAPSALDEEKQKGTTHETNNENLTKYIHDLRHYMFATLYNNLYIGIKQDNCSSSYENKYAALELTDMLKKVVINDEYHQGMGCEIALSKEKLRALHSLQDTVLSEAEKNNTNQLVS